MGPLSGLELELSRDASVNARKKNCGLSYRFGESKFVYGHYGEIILALF